MSTASNACVCTECGNYRSARGAERERGRGSSGTQLCAGTKGYRSEELRLLLPGCRCSTATIKVLLSLAHNVDQLTQVAKEERVRGEARRKVAHLRIFILAKGRSHINVVCA